MKTDHKSVENFLAQWEVGVVGRDRMEGRLMIKALLARAEAAESEREAVASSRCPMDGIDTPHSHDPLDVLAYLQRECVRFAPFHHQNFSIRYHTYDASTHTIVPNEMTHEMYAAILQHQFDGTAYREHGVQGGELFAQSQYRALLASVRNAAKRGE